MTPARAPIAALLALVLAGCAATAATRAPDGHHADLTFPASSPVTPVASDEAGGRRFAGRFTVTGDFHYIPGLPGRDAVLYFVPDPDMARRLPYFAHLGHVRRIAFDNPSTFLEDVVPAATLTRLANGELGVHAGRARIVVDGYFASVDCNQAGYTVTFVAVEWIGDAAAAPDPLPDPVDC
jgi:hypothetical protein